MTQKIYHILSRRFLERDKTKPWVFWHSYVDQKGKRQTGQFIDRREVLKNLCAKAGV